MNQATLRATIAQGLNSLGTLREDVTYTQHVSTTYTASTGAISETTKTKTVKAYLTQMWIRRQEDGRNVLKQEDVALIENQHIEPLVPTVNDSITKADGTVYKVFDYENPTNALYVIRLRK